MIRASHLAALLLLVIASAATATETGLPEADPGHVASVGTVASRNDQGNAPARSIPPRDRPDSALADDAGAATPRLRVAQPTPRPAMANVVKSSFKLPWQTGIFQ